MSFLIPRRFLCSSGKMRLVVSGGGHKAFCYPEKHLCCVARLCHGHTGARCTFPVCLTVLHARVAGEERVAISTLLACGRVHHHLVRNQMRSRVGLLLEGAEVRYFGCFICVCRDCSAVQASHQAQGSASYPGQSSAMHACN